METLLSLSIAIAAGLLLSRFVKPLKLPAVTGYLIAGILIYRFSPKPWFSFLVWNCLSVYVTYDYLAIKQGLAMAILMISLMCIFDRKPFCHHGRNDFGS